MHVFLKERTKSGEIHRSEEPHRTLQKSTEIHGNQQKPTEIHGNLQISRNPQISRNEFLDSTLGMGLSVFPICLTGR